MRNLFGEGATDYIDTSTVIDDIFNGPFIRRAQVLYVQADPETLFPEKGGSTRRAKAMCT